MGGNVSRSRDALLAAWHAKYRLPLLRFFERRTHSNIDREDLVQEVFTRLAKHENLGTVENVEPYLFQTAASVLADFGRRRKVRGGNLHGELDDDLVGDAALSPERVLIAKEAVEEMTRALVELPERTQDIFALYHFHEIPHREIAQRLGVSISTVEKEMAKANHHIMKRLGSIP